MGQPVAVVQKSTSRPGVARFELNRSLTGMSHESYRKADEIDRERPPDVLARRLFEVEGVEAVHIFSSIVTVELADGNKGEGLRQVIEDLFIHYLEGVVPSVIE